MGGQSRPFTYCKLHEVQRRIWEVTHYPTINSVELLVRTCSIFPWLVRVVSDRPVRYNGKYPRLHLPWVPEALNLTRAKSLWTRAPPIGKRRASYNPAYTKTSRIWPFCRLVPWRHRMFQMLRIGLQSQYARNRDAGCLKVTKIKSKQSKHTSGSSGTFRVDLFTDTAIILNLNFKEYHGMPREHSLSIYARFSGKKRTSLYISREKGYIQTRHNDLFSPLQSFSRKIQRKIGPLGIPKYSLNLSNSIWPSYR